LKTSKKPIKYFYLNDKLHKKLHINRGADVIQTWCYPLSKRVTYTYTDVKKNLQPGFTTQEVGKMLNRHRLTLERAILAGSIERPQFIYGLNEQKKMVRYMWSEKDILDAHAFLSTVHTGRPRHDGVVTPKRLPTRGELRAMIRQSEILYVQRDGKFVPVWDAEDFS
jgi:hypothetical protein